jgi:chaperone modulatory protein CbpM
MQIQQSEWHWLEATEIVSVQELCQSCSLSREQIDELVGYGALEPAPAEGDDTMFSADCVPVLRHASRMGRDFDLDMFTVGLLLGYLTRIEALERHVKSLEAHLPGHLHPPGGLREGPGRWYEPHAKAAT